MNEIYSRLQSCPFCGSCDLYIDKLVGFFTILKAVSCHDCQSRGVICEGTKEAISKWNSRLWVS